MHRLSNNMMVLGCAFFWGISGTAAEDRVVLDPGLAYQAQRGNEVTYDVDFAVAVTAPYQTQTLKVWLPLPQSDAGQEVTDGELVALPMKIAPQVASEPVFGNRFAYFEFHNPQGAQLIRHRFRIKVWELRWDIDPQRVVSPQNWPSAFAPYLRSEEQAVVVDSGIRDLLREIVPQRERRFESLASVLQWANEHFTYDHDQASLHASSLHALTKKRGHCSDYHGFCAAMGRALGYPTRIAYGINTFPKNSPSHCKLEAYLPPYGWVSFDASETQRLIELIRQDATLDAARRKDLVEAASRRLLRGFRDNTWFLQTRGTDYDLAPPAKRRVAVVRTIYAEADGQPLPEPDPAAHDRREFSWMTIHDYVADRPLTYPFHDWHSLEAEPPTKKHSKP